MNYQRLVFLFGFVAIVAWGQTATAASISLTPSSATVEAGSEFELAFGLDATPEAGDPNGLHPGSFFGEVRLDYDPDLLTFTAHSDQLQRLGTVTETLADGREAIRFEFSDVTFNSQPDAGVVGLFTFQANADLDSIATINIADNVAPDGPIGGSFFNNAGGAMNEFFVAPSSASVQVGSTVEPPSAVPLPAAAWLFLSALGALGFVGRKAKQTAHSA